MNTRDILNQISKGARPLDTGAAGLVKSIHRDPELRDWVTLESVLLSPVPAFDGARWSITGLLTVPTEIPEYGSAYAAPWGAIVWDLATGKVNRRIDLRDDIETRALRTFGPMLDVPADPACEKNDVESGRRSQYLYHCLDQLAAPEGGATDAARRTDKDLQVLAPVYAGLLPAAAYPYYWKVVPGCAEWLLPAAHEDSAEAANLAGDAQPMGAATDPKSGDLLNPVDLSSFVDAWIDEAERLAAELGNDPLQTNLADLRRSVKQPGCRITFIGEFSRGKSTAINRLLDRAVLPVGILPKTGIPTIIAAGGNERIEVIRKSGRREIRPLQADSWDGLLADTPEEADEATLVRVYVDSNWLADLDTEFIDTPGVNAVGSRSESTTFDIISRSDAVVIVVSAQQPLSLTEAAFIDQEVIGRHTVNVAAFVSKLDMVVLEERQEVFDIARRRVIEVAHGAAVQPLAPIDSSGSDVIEGARRVIEQMSARENRRAWRSHQVAGRTADYVSVIQQLAAGAIAASAEKAAEFRAVGEQLRHELNERDLLWQSLALDFEARRSTLESSNRERMKESEQDLIDSILFELNNTQDVKTWWETTFPYRLRREMVASARRSEDIVLRTIAADYEWLRSAVNERIGFNLGALSLDRSVQVPNTPAAAPVSEIRDSARYRMHSRIGIGVATAASMFLFGPIGAAVSASAGVASEVWISKAVVRQKAELTPLAEARVRAVCALSADTFGARLRDVYGKLLTDIRKMQQEWLGIQIAQIERWPVAGDSDRFKSIAARAAHLVDEINSWLPGR